MTYKLKTKCRYCKKEMKWTGQEYSYCNDKCKKLKAKQRKPSKLFPNLNKELKSLSLN